MFRTTFYCYFYLPQILYGIYACFLIQLLDKRPLKGIKKGSEPLKLHCHWCLYRKESMSGHLNN